MAANEFDVIVVGGGNAALCAAITAREEGAHVLLLERAPEEERGGNSSFTEGLMRFVYSGPEDIRTLSPDLTPDELASDFGRYTEETFFDDMARVTQNRTDPDLCEILVKQSNAVMHWMCRQGVRFLPQLGRRHLGGCRRRARPCRSALPRRAEKWGRDSLQRLGQGSHPLR